MKKEYIAPETVIEDILLDGLCVTIASPNDPDDSEALPGYENLGNRRNGYYVEEEEDEVDLW